MLSAASFQKLVAQIEKCGLDFDFHGGYYVKRIT
jgi:hypothetical protein